MASSPAHGVPSELYASETAKQCDEGRTKFHQMRDNLRLLKELFNESCSTQQTSQRSLVPRDNQKEFEKLFGTLETQLAEQGKQVLGEQRSMRKQIDDIKRQMTGEDRCNLACQKKWSDLELELKEEKMKIHHSEKYTAHLETTIAQMNLMLTGSVQGRSVSEPCLDRAEDDARTAFDDSCQTLDEIDTSMDRGPRRLIGSSRTTLETHDTGFSETSCRSLDESMRVLASKIDDLLKLSKESPKPRATRRGPDLSRLIRGFCVNIQEAVFSADRSRINQFSWSLGIDSRHLNELRDEVDYRQDLPSLFWAVVYEWNRLCQENGTRATMLTQILNACDECRVHNPLEVEPMSTRDRVIVEKNCSYLVRHIMIKPTMIYLRDSGRLTSGIMQYVTEPEAETDKILRLLDILPVCGRQALDILIKALRESGQGHIAEKIRSSDPQRFSREVMGQATGSTRDEFHSYPHQDIRPEKKKPFWKRRPKIFKSRQYKFTFD